MLPPQLVGVVGFILVCLVYGDRAPGEATRGDDAQAREGRPGCATRNQMAGGAGKP